MTTYPERPAQTLATAEAASGRYLPEPGVRFQMEGREIVLEPMGRFCAEECTCWEWATPEYTNTDPDLGRRGYGPLRVQVPLMGAARVTGSYEEPYDGEGA